MARRLRDLAAPQLLRQYLAALATIDQLQQENLKLRNRLAQQTDTVEWAQTVEKLGGDQTEVAKHVRDLTQPMPLWTPDALEALLQREAQPSPAQPKIGRAHV